MSRKTKLIVGFIVLLLIGAGAAAAILGTRSAVVEVETAAVRVETLGVAVTASGQIEMGERGDVFPRSPGVIEAILVEEGQQVASGTVIATLEREPFELQLKQAEAGLVQAESQLAAIERQEPGSGELRAARTATDVAWRQYQAAAKAAGASGGPGPMAAEVEAARRVTQETRRAHEQATVAFEAARSAHEASPTPTLEGARVAAEATMLQARQAHIAAQQREAGLVAANEAAARQQALAARDQAHIGYLTAKAQQDRLESTDLSPERRAARAAISQARDAVALAQRNLDESALVAPVNGVVVFRSAGSAIPGAPAVKPTIGTPVSPQAAPFSVVNMTTGQFVAQVDEADIARVAEDKKALIRVDAFPLAELSGVVTRISPIAEITATGGTTFLVYIELAEVPADVELRDGMQGDAGIEIEAISEAMTIPIEALFDEGGQTHVYVLTNGQTLVRTRVEVGTVTETEAQVLSGLEEGDEVALSGPTELTDGLRVRPAE